MKPRKHAEVIKQWADGAEIEWFYCGKWVITNPPFWLEEREYRVTPEKIVRAVEVGDKDTIIEDLKFNLSRLEVRFEHLAASLQLLRRDFYK